MNLKINLNWIIGFFLCMGLLIEALITHNEIIRYIAIIGLIYLFGRN